MSTTVRLTQFTDPMCTWCWGSEPVLLVHGITQDMDDGGMFTRLANRLSAIGFDVVRFTFRGHGDGDGTDRGATVGGELLDFETAFEHTRDRFDGPQFVVAKSFGAVATCLSLDRYEADLAGVVLWNPVLDVEGTFLDPRTSWGVEQFAGEALDELDAAGHVTLDGGFRVGRALWEELHEHDPGARFVRSSVPALVGHGDADEVVSHEDARRVAAETGADFHTVADADHGFVTPAMRPLPSEDAREQDRLTVEWLTARADG